jgi:DNA-binding transcriptional LysR family regulator
VERQIGAPLFERTSRRVELTPIGRRLGDRLRPAYQQIQEALDEAVAGAGGVRGTLRVGFVGAAAGKFVLEVAEAVRAEHPECEVQFREKQFGAGLGPLRGGEFDMLLATVPVFGARSPIIVVSCRGPSPHTPSRGASPRTPSSVGCLGGCCDPGMRCHPAANAAVGPRALPADAQAHRSALERDSSLTA